MNICCKCGQQFPADNIVSKDMQWTLTRRQRGPRGFRTKTIEHTEAQMVNDDGYRLFVLFPVQGGSCQDVLQIGAAEFKTPTPEPEPELQTRQPAHLRDDASTAASTVGLTERMYGRVAKPEITQQTWSQDVAPMDEVQSWPDSGGSDVSQDPQTMHNSLHQNPHHKRSRGGPGASRGPHRGETQHLPPMPNSLHQTPQQMRSHGGLDGKRTKQEYTHAAWRELCGMTRQMQRRMRGNTVHQPQHVPVSQCSWEMMPSQGPPQQKTETGSRFKKKNGEQNRNRQGLAAAM